ncbi:hypothetical protein Vadar_000385 [Vaccinium darrowii]|uniref:Uncharacterized protein n=1 Tax=Vaccinium darrowii TaxID=229202 RepID=A0ACB7X6V2_9ERIC|nr:hypothetical protein Vadar_000385 [Vaccinium darrowii]
MRLGRVSMYFLIVVKVLLQQFVVADANVLLPATASMQFYCCPKEACCSSLLATRCSAGIWSVGCTAIEMATARPPWNKQYEEFAALYHIGTTKYHPPIPDHLSVEEEDFLTVPVQDEIIANLDWNVVEPQPTVGFSTWQTTEITL